MQSRIPRNKRPVKSTRETREKLESKRVFEKEREVEREERGSCEVSSSSFPSDWLTAPSSPCVGTLTREWNRIGLFVSLGEHYDSLPIIGRYNHYPACSGRTWISPSYSTYPFRASSYERSSAAVHRQRVPDMTLPPKKNYELPLHPLFDSLSLRHGIGKRAALWKNVELFTAHAINLVMNLTRARYYFIFRDSLNDDAWHFARFYITRRMYETNKWNEREIIFRKYWKTLLDDVAELSVYKVFLVPIIPFVFA